MTNRDDPCTSPRSVDTTRPVTRMGERENRLSMRCPRSINPVYFRDTSATCDGIDGDDIDGGDCVVVVVDDDDDDDDDGL